MRGPREGEKGHIPKKAGVYEFGSSSHSGLFCNVAADPQAVLRLSLNQTLLLKRHAEAGAVRVRLYLVNLGVWNILKSFGAE